MPYILKIHDAYLLGVIGDTVLTTRRKKGAKWLSRKNAEALSNYFDNSIIEEIKPVKKTI